MNKSKNISMKVFVRTIFNAIPACRPLLEQADDIIDQISLELTSETDNTLTTFITFLHHDCQLTLKTVAQIINGFNNHADAKKALGAKLAPSWLMFKIYELKDLLKDTQADNAKRDQISAFFDKCDFPKFTLVKLIRKCLKIIKGSDPQESEVSLLKGKIDECRNAALNQLFSSISLNISTLTYNPDKSIHEQLQDLLSDFHYYPNDSIEKDIQKEIIIAFAQKNPQIKQKLEKLEKQDKKENHFRSINSKISQMESKITREFRTLLSPEVSRNFKELKENPSESYTYLCTLKANLLGINVLELERLVSRTKEAQNLIKNKDVILILGGTGSGKSTNILKFLGYRLKQQYYNSLATLVPVEDVSRQHQTFYTSPEGKSCTRFINATPVPDKMYTIGTPEYKKTYVLCDTPGFGDSAGIQVDIANGVGMINALYGARSVRVVLLLSYDVVTANRSAALVPICETIGSIFTNFQNAVGCITVLFNKVPQDQYEQVKHTIANKIEHLTHVQKSNSLVTTFMNKILTASEEETSFLDPLNGDYKRVFKEIIRTSLINDPVSQFRYDFTQNTKKQIACYATIKKAKIKQIFDSKKYESAKLQLTMIQKLKNILISNEQIQHTYRDLIRYISQSSQREVAKFEEIVLQKLTTGEINQRQAATMRDSRDKVITIAEKFSELEDIHVVPSQVVQDIITAQASKLEAEFDNCQGNNGEHLLKRIKIFCNELYHEFEDKFLFKVENQFRDERNKMIQLIEQRNTGPMLEVAKKLKWLLKSIVSFKQHHPLIRQIEEIKQHLQQLFRKNMEQLKEQLLSENAINEKVIQSGRKNMLAMKNIEALMLITGINTKKQIANCQKSVESKCFKLIKHLKSQIAAVVQQQLHQYASSASMVSLKPLITLEKQIQMFLAFESTRQSLAEEYTTMKFEVRQKLQANAHILATYISDIKSVRNNTISDQINIIRTAFDVLNRCCQIINARDAQLQILQLIEPAVIEYLQREKNAMNSIQLKLSANFKDIFPKIQKLYNKISVLDRLNVIGETPKFLIAELHGQFIEKLKMIFKQFKENQIASLLKNDNYRHLQHIMDKFDRFCCFASEMEKLLSPTSEYSDINGDEEQIENSMQKYLDVIREESKDFIDMEVQGLPQPPYLRDLVKVLVTINQKQAVCKYLVSRMSIDISEIIRSIVEQMEFVKEKIQQKLEGYLNAENKITYLLTLMGAAKYYTSVEEVLKLKTKEDLQFKELEKKINQCYSDNLKNDEECAISFIRDNRPSQICFPDLAVIYRQFNTLATPDGARKKGIITLQLKKVERGIIDSLKSYKYKMTSLNNDFINDRPMMHQLGDKLSEAIQLDKELNGFYEGQDKRLIDIGQNIKQLGKSCIEFLKETYSQTLQLLNSFQFAAAENKINGINSFQSIIYDNPYFLQENTSKPLSIQLTTFLQEANTHLWKEIKRYESFEPDKSAFSFRQQKRLHYLLDMLRQKIKSCIESKFCWYNSERFSIDDDFNKYYSTFRNVTTQDMKEKKEGLEYNLKIYFNNLLKEFKQATGPEAEIIMGKMQNCFSYLPYDLKPIYAPLLQAIKSGNTETVSPIETQQKKKMKSLPQLYTAFVDDYIQKNDDSFFQEVLKVCFENEKVKMMENIMQTQAFPNFQGAFFDRLGQSEFMIRRLKKELNENIQMIKQLLQQHKQTSTSIIKLQNITNKFKKVVRVASITTALKRSSSQ